MSAFIKSIQNTASKYDLWSRGSKIIVGVSGGPDSVCLLDTLVCLKNKYNWSLHIAHVNYRLRKDDSQKDESFVRDLAEKYHLPISVLEPTIVQQNNLEEHLRDIRYRFFEQIRQKFHYDTIAVAHTRDDQAETILMHILRGAGLSGLRGMHPKNNAIIRPFLETSRMRVLQQLRKQDIPYRIDQSNTDERFLRNRIRHQLIPYLENHFNPSIKNTLSHSATVISEDYRFLYSFLTPFPIPFQHKDQSITFQANALLQVHPSLQNMILREFFQKLQGNACGITSSHIQEVLSVIRSRKSKHHTTTFSRLNVIRKGDTVTLSM